MSFGFKPDKINNFYALMAALAVVIGTILFYWMSETDTDVAKSITGTITIIFFAFFLIIIYKVLTHQRTADSINKDTGLNEGHVEVQQRQLLIIFVHLNEQKLLHTKNEDWTAVQNIDFAIESVKKMLKPVPRESGKGNESFDSNDFDITQLMTKVTSTIRK